MGIFVASAYKIPRYHGYQVKQKLDLMDAYNKVFSKIIDDEAKKRNLGDRLHWMQVAHKITLAPVRYENIPLLPDGVHLQQKYIETNLQDTHQAIANVILNVYCEKKMKY